MRTKCPAHPILNLVIQIVIDEEKTLEGRIVRGPLNPALQLEGS
jgi:hypothetical protein